MDRPKVIEKWGLGEFVSSLGASFALQPWQKKLIQDLEDYNRYKVIDKKRANVARRLLATGHYRSFKDAWRSLEQLRKAEPLRAEELCGIGADMVIQDDIPVDPYMNNVNPFAHVRNDDPRCPVIICAICNKRVDSVELFRDEMKCCDVYKVRCHGDTDTCEIDDHFRMNAGPHEIKEGRAFATKRIENA
jgi:hypothetical protein